MKKEPASCPTCGTDLAWKNDETGWIPDAELVALELLAALKNLTALADPPSLKPGQQRQARDETLENSAWIRPVR